MAGAKMSRRRYRVGRRGENSEGVVRITLYYGRDETYVYLYIIRWLRRSVRFYFLAALRPKCSCTAELYRTVADRRKYETI